MNGEMDNNSPFQGSPVESLPVPLSSKPPLPTDFSCQPDNDEDGDNSPHLLLSEGNSHFVHKRFSSAINSYSRGLSQLERNIMRREEEKHAENQPKILSNNGTNEGKELEGDNDTDVDTHVGDDDDAIFLDLLSNRALVYISIGNYSAALEDTKRVLSKRPTHFKGICRQVKALTGLKQYQKAIELVDCSIKLLLKSEKNKKSKKDKQSLKEQLKELLQLLEQSRWKKYQSETGELYDVPMIMDKPFEPAPDEWVDYIGPVTVENIPGKGRGLVATEDLPASKLVFACRAFEIIFLDGKSDPEKSVSEESEKALNNGKIKLEQDHTLNLLARRVYDRLTKNPERRAEFYQLHAGNNLGHIEPSNDANPDEPPLPMDMTRIYGICRTNTFANSGDTYPEVEKSVGIWIFPAFVNHQCVGGNCTWKIFGDFIFVRAYRPIKKGEELIHSYVSPAYSLQARTNTLTKRLGFVCGCALCELDRKLPPSVHEEKMKLKQLALNQEVKFAQIGEIPQNSADYQKKMQASILLLEQIVAKLERIQPEHGPYNASLLDPLQKLGLKYFGAGEFQKTIKTMERAISLMKSCTLPHAIADCSMWIIAAYLQMGQPKQAKKWGKVLKEHLIMAYGDVKVLNMLGSWALELLIQWGLAD